MHRAQSNEYQKPYPITDCNRSFAAIDEDDLWVTFNYSNFDGRKETTRYPMELVRKRLQSDRIPPSYDLTDCNPEVSSAFLEFILKNSIDYTAYTKSYEFIGDLAFLADTFRCVDLLKDLVGAIELLIHKDHSDDWIHACKMLTRINGCQELKEMVLSQMASEFLELNKEILVDEKMLRQLLNRCDLNISDESEVLLFLVEWSAFHQPRLDDFGFLLSAIRKHLIDDDTCYSILYGMADSAHLIVYKQELSKWIVEGCHNFICWKSDHVMGGRPRCKAPVRRLTRRSMPIPMPMAPRPNQFELELTPSKRMTLQAIEGPAGYTFGSQHEAHSNRNQIKHRPSLIKSLARDTKRVVAGKLRQVLNKLEK